MLPLIDFIILYSSKAITGLRESGQCMPTSPHSDFCLFFRSNGVITKKTCGPNWEWNSRLAHLAAFVRLYVASTIVSSKKISGLISLIRRLVISVWCLVQLAKSNNTLQSQDTLEILGYCNISRASEKLRTSEQSQNIQSIRFFGKQRDIQTISSSRPLEQKCEREGLLQMQVKGRSFWKGSEKRMHFPQTELEGRRFCTACRKRTCWASFFGGVPSDSRFDTPEILKIYPKSGWNQITQQEKPRTNWYGKEHQFLTPYATFLMSGFVNPVTLRVGLVMFWPCSPGARNLGLNYHFCKSNPWGCCGAPLCNR